jgi:hypothetical protein
MPALYVDATSGGMALQIILSGLVGGLVVIKLFWHNLVSAVFFWKRAPEASTDQASTEQDA